MHPNPPEAKSDKEQALTFDDFGAIMAISRRFRHGRDAQVTRVNGAEWRGSKVRGIRGAITVTGDEAPAIVAATKRLLTAMTQRNEVEIDDIASVLFSLTPDLRAAFPALGAREMGWMHVPMLHFTEIDVPGSLGPCIRVLMHVNTMRALDAIDHVYLDGAVVLRPDLARTSDAVARCRIGIFGTGMIGASAGLAARARGDEVLGFDPDANAATQALELGAIDRIVGRDELYATCDAVILAPHLHATLDELARIASHTFRNELLIIDVASVKTPVAQAGSAQAAFVPAHPMAGRERHGPAAARADLFTDRTWCYVPTSDAARTERARALIERLGAIPVAVDAREHDRIVALTSHLPQLIAYAFTQCVGELEPIHRRSTPCADRPRASFCGSGARAPRCGTTSSLPTPRR